MSTCSTPTWRSCLGACAPTPLSRVHTQQLVAARTTLADTPHRCSNPPFGTRRKGADTEFLQAACQIARRAVYSLHKARRKLCKACLTSHEPDATWPPGHTDLHARACATLR